MPNVAMDSVRAFVARADPGFAATLDTAYGRVQQVLGERQVPCIPSSWG
jgi:hypothetical protein